MKSPSVSIVLLNWNNSEETKECIKSIKKLTYENFDTWVLDNGSTDDSVKELKKLESKRISLVLGKENHGFAEGNNFLVKEILKTKNPDYVLILNNDTILPKELLSELVGAAEKRNASVIGPRLIDSEGNEIPNFCEMDKFLLNSNWEFPGNKNKIIKTDCVAGCCMLIKTEDYLRFGGFKKEYFIYNEETDLCFRMKKKGKKLFLNLNTTIIHAEGASFKKERKIPLYYHTRNQFLLRKDHYKFPMYTLFVMKYSLIEVPKKIIYLTITRQIKMIPTYFKGIFHGLFNLRGKRM